MKRNWRRKNNGFFFLLLFISNVFIYINKGDGVRKMKKKLRRAKKLEVKKKIHIGKKEEKNQSKRVYPMFGLMCVSMFGSVKPVCLYMCRVRYIISSHTFCCCCLHHSCVFPLFCKHTYTKYLYYTICMSIA